MKQTCRKQSGQEVYRSRMASWGKRVAVAALGVTLALGLMGCSLDDILAPFGAADIPFEQKPTTSPDIGAVDDRPTVPGDAPFDDIGFDFPPV